MFVSLSSPPFRPSGKYMGVLAHEHHVNRFVGDSLKTGRFARRILICFIAFSGTGFEGFG